jgi:hypothetical protein
MVVVDNMMPQVLRTKLILEEQGFQVQPVKILQDKRRAMLRGEWQDFKLKEDKTYSSLVLLCY